MLFINYTMLYYLIIFSLILIMISLILVFKESKFVQFLGFLFVLGLTFYSKSDWCYLVLVIYIVLKLNLLDDEFLASLNCLKQAWQGCYKIKNLDNKDKENKKEETINETRNTSEKEPQINPKFIFNNYEKSESSVVNWFALNTKLLFERNKKIINKNRISICPDGIFETETNISILEVKRGFEKSNNRALFQKGIETLLKNKKFYENSNKSIDLYLAFVFDEKNNEKQNIKDYIEQHNLQYIYNINVYLFEQKEQEVTFIEKTII